MKVNPSTTIRIPTRLAPTTPRFHHACKVPYEGGGYTYVHDWRFHELYIDYRNNSEYMIWYCTRCREVRHDPNGAPSY